MNDIPKTELLLDIIIRGTFPGMEGLDPDIGVMRALEILTKAAENDPITLLKVIRDAVEVKIDGMVIVALAMLTAKADGNFLSKNEVSGTIISILEIYGPPKLLEYVEYLKSKVFGRGFGSRPQKWVRMIMEEWQIDVVDMYLSKHTSAFYSLVRLIHPRYHGSRGYLITDTLDLKRNKI